MATEEGVAGTGLEIRDSFGEKLEYESKISDLDNNQITFFYTADRDDVYQVLFRVITLTKPAVCTYMAVMKGELDPELGGEE